MDCAHARNVSDLVWSFAHASTCCRFRADGVSPTGVACVNGVDNGSYGRVDGADKPAGNAPDGDGNGKGPPGAGPAAGPASAAAPVGAGKDSRNAVNGAPSP
jgi:hypothetical protein